MNPRIIVLAIAALVVAGLTAFLARQFLLGTAPPEEPEVDTATTEILVASKNLPQGHLVEAEDLVWAKWPNEGLHPNYMDQNSVELEDLTGYVVRYGIIGGEPVSRGRVIAPGEKGFVAAVLTPGMRAVTVPVNRTSGLAGLVFPGDRVDVLLIRSVRDDRGILHRVGETVVKNIRVIAVDVRVDDQEKGNPSLAKSVTLEVPPKMAEKVAMLTRMGEIALALRSLKSVDSQGIEIYSPEDDLPISNAQTFTWDAEVSPLSPPVNPPLEVLTVSRGSNNQVFSMDGSDNLGASDPVFADDQEDEAGDNSENGGQ